jgi:hypothetical protein
MSHTPAQLALEKAMTDSITRMSDTIIELLARVSALEARLNLLESEPEESPLARRDAYLGRAHD